MFFFIYFLVSYVPNENHSIDQEEDSRRGAQLSTISKSGKVEEKTNSDIQQTYEQKQNEELSEGQRHDGDQPLEKIGYKEEHEGDINKDDGEGRNEEKDEGEEEGEEEEEEEEEEGERGKDGGKK